jgi:hypothetical protein
MARDSHWDAAQPHTDAVPFDARGYRGLFCPSDS